MKHIEPWLTKEGSWCRRCPVCKRTLSYTGEVARWTAMEAVRKNRTCRSCKHQKQRHVTGNQHQSFKGCGSVPHTYFTITKKSARERKIPFRISIKQMSRVFESQRGKCALTEIPLSFGVWDMGVRKAGNASLDRIDSSKGYVKENVQWIDKDINNMKGILAEMRFIELCKLVAKKH